MGPSSRCPRFYRGILASPHSSKKQEKEHPMPSFSESVLDKRAEDVKEPPVKPAGTYLFLIQGQFVEGVSSQKRTPWVGWNIKCLAAQEDVNREELEAAGGIETWVGRPSAASGLHYYI